MVPTVNKVKGREILRSLLSLPFLTLSLSRVTFILPLVLCIATRTCPEGLPTKSKYYFQNMTSKLDIPPQGNAGQYNYLL